MKVEGHKNTSRKPVTLITGAGGEIGQELIRHLTMAKNEANIVTLDRNALDETSRRRVGRAIVGDILDAELLASLWNDYEIETVFHLAALLSTRAERDPELAYRVNVQGTLNLLKLATDHGRLRGQAVKFVYPSSIAVYGLPDLETKRRAGAVREDQYLQPTTMYGCNKLSCEHLGNYYAEHYQQVADRNTIRVDFRCIRFPGLISIQTTPAGGTSDFAPEMVHAAAESRPYAAFVRPGTQIPFMVMPDAVKSLLMLTEASPHALKRRVYNVNSFSLPAIELAERVRGFWPTASITFVPDEARQRILDTWPSDTNDSAAQSDWEWSPDYGLDRAFSNYIALAVLGRDS